MRNLSLFGSLSLVVLANSTVYGQESPPPPAAKTEQLDRIFVTSTKREEMLQDVPLSVSVTDAATIEKANIRDLIDLQSVEIGRAHV